HILCSKCLLLKQKKKNELNTCFSSDIKRNIVKELKINYSIAIGKIWQIGYWVDKLQKK
ncbi:MAG: hypothetical protein ACJA2S_004927, partial [Cyclobacteriaceae bacterium]